MNFRLTALFFVAAHLLAIAPYAWAAEAPKESAEPPADTRSVNGAEASGLEVVVKSAKVDFVVLKKPLPGGAFDELVSREKLLMISLTITNKGQKPITYKSFNGTLDGKEGRASLMTTLKKLLPLVNFGEMELADAIKEATLKPGESVTDALCFMAPPENVIPETLFLPAKNHGDGGYWKIAVKVEAQK